MAHEEYDSRCCDRRNDQRQIAVEQVELNEQSHETNGSDLRRNHHNCEDEDECRTLELEIIDNKAVGGHTGEENRQSTAAACDDEGVFHTDERREEVVIQRIIAQRLHIVKEMCAGDQRNAADDIVMQAGCVDNEDPDRHEADQSQQDQNNINRRGLDQNMSLIAALIGRICNLTHMLNPPPFCLRFHSLIASFCLRFFSIASLSRWT